MSTQAVRPMGKSKEGELVALRAFVHIGWGQAVLIEISYQDGND